MIVAISCGKKNDSENDDDNIRNTQEIIVDNLLLNVESNEASAMEESYRVGGKINYISSNYLTLVSDASKYEVRVYFSKKQLAKLTTEDYIAFYGKITDIEEGENGKKYVNFKHPKYDGLIEERHTLEITEDDVRDIILEDTEIDHLDTVTIEEIEYSRDPGGPFTQNADIKIRCTYDNGAAKWEWSSEMSTSMNLDGKDNWEKLKFNSYYISSNYGSYELYDLNGTWKGEWVVYQDTDIYHTNDDYDVELERHSIEVNVTNTDVINKKVAGTIIIDGTKSYDLSEYGKILEESDYGYEDSIGKNYGLKVDVPFAINREGKELSLSVCFYGMVKLDGSMTNTWISTNTIWGDKYIAKISD